MIDALSKLTWPGAVVLSVGLIAAACALIGAFVGLSGSRFPWEK